MVDLKSTTLPSFVAEAARIYFNAERALTIPQSNVSFNFGDNVLTVSGSLPVSVSTVLASGNVAVAFTDAIPTVDPVLTGTPMSDLTADNLAEVLFNAVVRLDAAESVLIAANEPIPDGVGSTYTITADTATFNSALPYTVAISSTGEQVLTILDYTA